MAGKKRLIKATGVKSQKGEKNQAQKEIIAGVGDPNSVESGFFYHIGSGSGSGFRFGSKTATDLFYITILHNFCKISTVKWSK